MSSSPPVFLSTPTLSPSPVSTLLSPSTVQLVGSESESMFDSHPIRFLLQCTRHSTTAAPTPTTAPHATAGIGVTTTSTTNTSSNATLTLKLRIPSTETRTDEMKKTYTVFLIQMLSCCSSFSVLRRYSDFISLHRDLTLEFPQLVSKLPTLPGKKLLGSSLDAEFVAQRRAALEAYLLKLFADSTFVNSKSLCQFFVQIREVSAVSVRVGQGSNPVSRTTSSASSTDTDVASLTARMSSIANHLLSLEQKLTWASSGSGQSTSMEHEMRVMQNTIENLKKKVGVLELAQPYLQQMATVNTSTMSSSTSSTSTSQSTQPPKSLLASSAGMNGNARPFQSGNRSISGPVSTIKYDWNHDDYSETVDDDDGDGEIARHSDI